MLVYSIRQARHGRQASKIRAMSKVGTQLSAQQVSVLKPPKNDSASLTIMLQNERKHHTHTNAGIPTQRVKDI